MGLRKFSKRSFPTPKKPWDHSRFLEESKLIKEFGLRKKSEIWRAEGVFRKISYKLNKLSQDPEKLTLEVSRLVEKGILDEDSLTEDISETLSKFSVSNILRNRLQSKVSECFRISMKDARNRVISRRVTVEGRVVDVPSYSIRRGSRIEIR